LTSGNGDLPSCNWDSEFNTKEGIRFETEAGPVWIPGDVAERWVTSMPIDGAAVLESALRYLEQRGLIAPGKTALITLLAEYARKVTSGYEGADLDRMLGPLADAWIDNKVEASTAA